MKKLIVVFFLLFAGFGTEVKAQAKTGELTQERVTERRGRGTETRVARQLEMLTEALALSEEQVGEVSVILNKMAAQMEAMRGTGDRAANREKGQAMRQEMDVAIEAVLNKKQLKRYENYKKRRAERGPRRGGRQ